MRVQNLTGIVGNRWIALSILAAAMLLGAVYLAGSGLVRYISCLQRVAILDAELARIALRKVNLESAKNQLDLDDKKLSAILDELLSAGRKSAVLLGETAIAEMTQHESYRALPVSVTIKGTYNQIGKFVSLIEKNPRFQIFELNLSTKETKGAGIIGELKAEFIFL